MSNSLETQLIAGGVSPVAAKVISNAIENASSERMSLGRQVEDATPTDRMRMIDADTRRYLLTNLDYASDKRLNPSARYSPRAKQHPYQDSQPASATPTISTPGVKAGKFMSVNAQTSNQVAQAEVGLNVQQMGGRHARINAATGVVESIPIELKFEPEGVFAGEVVEESGKTVIKIRIVSEVLLGVLGKKLGKYTSITYLNQPCVLQVDGAVISANAAFLLVPK